MEDGIIKVFLEAYLDDDLPTIDRLRDTIIEYFPGVRFTNHNEADIKITYYNDVYNINGFRRQSIEETIEYLRLLAPRYLQEFVED